MYFLSKISCQSHFHSSITCIARDFGLFHARKLSNWLRNGGGSTQVPVRAPRWPLVPEIIHGRVGQLRSLLQVKAGKGRNKTVLVQLKTQQNKHILVLHRYLFTKNLIYPPLKMGTMDYINNRPALPTQAVFVWVHLYLQWNLNSLCHSYGNFVIISLFQFFFVWGVSIHKSISWKLIYM